MSQGPVKPNFFIVGAPKCGTTAWYEYLSPHSRIFFPAWKEPNYFCDDFPNWGRVSDLGQYLEFYRDSGGAAVLGDASPYHLYSERAADNIKRFNPEAKILILLRDQADFFASLHNQHLFSGVESIEDSAVAWRLSGKRDSSNMPRTAGEAKMLDYKRLGAFNEQVERYYGAFDPQQILVLRFAEWTRDVRSTYARILAFLELPVDGKDEFPRVNQAHVHRFGFIPALVREPPPVVKSAVKLLRRVAGRQGLGVGQMLLRLNRRSGSLSSVSPALRQEIQDHYKQDNERLAELLSRQAA